MELTGNVFVVTGGGNGIGREVVLGLLTRGARVAAVDLSEQGLAETAALAGAGERLSTHTVDITDRAAVEVLPDAVISAHGRVDGLLNVAGIIQPFVRFADLEYGHIEKVMAVNFWGVVHTTKAFLPHLRSRPQAAVVNVSSMGALAPVPGQAVYGASKAAVMLLTEALYAELKGTPVTVSVVFPGGVSTHIAENSGAAIPGREHGRRGLGGQPHHGSRRRSPDHRQGRRRRQLPRRHRQGRAHARLDVAAVPAPGHRPHREEDGRAAQLICMAPARWPSQRRRAASTPQ
jgi:NAD(P)-dependent dehydrogenase (short-subunit alcohol dehydrogenase family)